LLWNRPVVGSPIFSPARAGLSSASTGQNRQRNCFPSSLRLTAADPVGGGICSKQALGEYWALHGRGGISAEDAREAEAEAEAAYLAAGASETWRCIQRCKSCEFELDGLARGDGEWSLNDGQIPKPIVLRVALGTGHTIVYRGVGGRRVTAP
jgi:hypothetical protein